MSSERPSMDPARDWDGEWTGHQETLSDDLWLVTERLKLRYLNRYGPPPGTVLEVGCGSAKLSAMLARAGSTTVGLDLSAAGLELARRNYQSWNLESRLVRGDIFSLPFADHSFDLVISTGLLEHFTAPQLVVNEMTRVLRPGGTFFSDVVPLKFSLIRSLWYARGLHRAVDDEYPYRGPDVKGWLVEAGLEEIDVFPSCVIPPLGLFDRMPGGRRLVRALDPVWRAADGTTFADWLGFFYIALGRKPRAR